MIDTKQINFLKDNLGRILVNNSIKSVASQKTRTGEVLGVSNVFFTIPNNKKWIVSEIHGGSSVDPMGCKVSLFYAPNGNDNSLTLIDCLFCNGDNQIKQISYQSPLGDGTKSLLLRRERLAKAMINGSFIYNEVENE
jgi:hypothetical protein